jgi:opine dehydrogenase
MEKIAILGGGVGGQTCTADLSMAGYSVNLFELPRFKAPHIDAILKRGGIQIDGIRKGLIKPNMVTTDIGKAMDDVDLVFIVVPAFARRRFTEVCIPYLREGQTIVYLGAHGGSCLIFAKLSKELGMGQNVIIGETHTLPYSTRFTGPGELRVPFRNLSLLTAAFPAKDTGKIVDVLKRIYPSNKIVPAVSILEIMLQPQVQAVGCICNLSRIDLKEDWLFYREPGRTPSIKRISEAVRRETGNVTQAFGIQPRSPDELVLVPSEELRAAFASLAKGPITTKDRFITEDVPFGAVTIASLGDAVGVETPILDAIIQISSLINETDYWKEGWTVETLGLSGMGVEELKKFVTEGRI